MLCFFFPRQAKETVTSKKSVRNNLAVIILDEGSANYGYVIKYNQPCGFVNEILLKQSHDHLFVYCLWPLSCSIAELSNDRDIMPQSLKYCIYYLALYRVSSQTCTLGGSDGNQRSNTSNFSECLCIRSIMRPNMYVWKKKKAQLYIQSVGTTISYWRG